MHLTVKLIAALRRDQGNWHGPDADLPAAQVGGDAHEDVHIDHHGRAHHSAASELLSLATANLWHMTNNVSDHADQTRRLAAPDQPHRQGVRQRAQALPHRTEEALHGHAAPEEEGQARPNRSDPVDDRNVHDGHLGEARRTGRRRPEGAARGDGGGAPPVLRLRAHAAAGGEGGVRHHVRVGASARGNGLDWAVHQRSEHTARAVGDDDPGVARATVGDGDLRGSAADGRRLADALLDIDGVAQELGRFDQFAAQQRFAGVHDSGWGTVSAVGVAGTW